MAKRSENDGLVESGSLLARWQKKQEAKAQSGGSGGGEKGSASPSEGSSSSGSRRFRVLHGLGTALAALEEDDDF